MPGTVALRQPGGVSAFNDTSGQVELIPHPAYATDLPCRVQALTAQARTVAAAAGDDEVVADYLITVPLATNGVLEGHLATVTDTGDPDLDGHTLRVVQVVRGTHRFERDLFCTLTD